MIKEPIHIKVILEEQEHLLTTYRGEYRNLMQLITDKLYVEDFGECKGLGRCATCLVKVQSSGSPTLSLDRNERATLEKAGIFQPELRLACQILVDAALDNVIVLVAEKDEP